MNRTAFRRLKARKAHAARSRYMHRLVDEALKRVAASIVEAVNANRTFADAARGAARAIASFTAEVVVGRMIRQQLQATAGELFAVNPDGSRSHLGALTFHAGGYHPLLCPQPAGLRVGVDLPADDPRRAHRCGSCGEIIRPDPATGTTCGCAMCRRQFLPSADGQPPRPRTWSPLLCTCTGSGPTCGYCRDQGVP